MRKIKLREFVGLLWPSFMALFYLRIKKTRAEVWGLNDPHWVAQCLCSGFYCCHYFLLCFVSAFIGCSTIIVFIQKLVDWRFEPSTQDFVRMLSARSQQVMRPSITGNVQNHFFLLWLCDWEWKFLHLVSKSQGFYKHSWIQRSATNSERIILFRMPRVLKLSASNTQRKYYEKTYTDWKLSMQKQSPLVGNTRQCTMELNMSAHSWGTQI